MLNPYMTYYSFNILLHTCTEWVRSLHIFSQLHAVHVIICHVFVSVDSYADASVSQFSFPSSNQQQQQYHQQQQQHYNGMASEASDQTFGKSYN